MVAGHLRERNGIYHMVLSYTDENGKRMTPSRSTGLPVKSNKRRAESMLDVWRSETEVELEQRIQEHARNHSAIPQDIQFTKFMLDWLAMMKDSVETTTHAGYSLIIKNQINPYFDKHYPQPTQFFPSARPTCEGKKRGSFQKKRSLKASKKWCRRPDSNGYAVKLQGILSPWCLPFHHAGLCIFRRSIYHLPVKVSSASWFSLSCF